MNSVVKIVVTTSPVKVTLNTPKYGASEIVLPADGTEHVVNLEAGASIIVAPAEGE